MPTDMAVLYQAWLDANPSKVNRLAEIVAETVLTFRTAVESQPSNVMDPDLTKIPVTGFRHAQNLVLFTLGMEMGIDFAPEVYSLNVQANIWLRMVGTGKLKALADETVAGEGTPSYCVRRGAPAHGVTAGGGRWPWW
jgi:hypothetical protein